MNTITNSSDIIFSRTIDGFGEVSLRPMNIEKDAEFLFDWVTRPYAKYWGMLDNTIEDVHKAYKELETRDNYQVLIGVYNNIPVFLTEVYKADKDDISKYYDAKEDDYGMHILVGPPEQQIHNFTWNVFTTVLEFMFSQSQIKRVVVEPDVRNEKIHVLNKKAGFIYDKEVQLPHKKAALAFCTRTTYKKAKLQVLNS